MKLSISLLIGGLIALTTCHPVISPIKKEWQEIRPDVETPPEYKFAPPSSPPKTTLPTHHHAKPTVHPAASHEKRSSYACHDLSATPGWFLERYCATHSPREDSTITARSAPFPTNSTSPAPNKALTEALNELRAALHLLAPDPQVPCSTTEPLSTALFPGINNETLPSCFGLRILYLLHHPLDDPKPHNPISDAFADLETLADASDRADSALSHSIHESIIAARTEVRARIASEALSSAATRAYFKASPSFHDVDVLFDARGNEVMKQTAAELFGLGTHVNATEYQIKAHWLKKATKGDEVLHAAVKKALKGGREWRDLRYADVAAGEFVRVARARSDEKAREAAALMGADEMAHKRLGEALGRIREEGMPGRVLENLGAGEAE